MLNTFACHYILVGSAEVVIIYIDIVHDYQKACVLNYTQDESSAGFPV
jgi:hypothetical protein